MTKRIFNWLSTRVSYGFAIAVFSVLGGQASAMLGFLFILMINDFTPEQLLLHAGILVGGVLIATVVHYTLFGMLRPLKRRWEPSGLRRLNDWFVGDRIDEGISTEDLAEVTKTLEWLPITSRRLAALLSSLVVAAEVIVGLQIETWDTAMRFLLGGMTAILLYVIFITVVTELLTRPGLNEARRMLALRGAWRGPSRQTALTIKLQLFVGVIAIGLLAIISIFMLRPSVIQSPGTVFLLSGLILSAAAFMSALIFHAIIRPLQEIEEAANLLVSAQKAEFLSGSTNREFLSLAQHVYTAAQRIVKYQSDLQSLNEALERRVIERTAELEARQEELRQRTLELEARNAELDAFAHTVAHDLKNPLSSLVGLSTMLEECLPDMSPEEAIATLHRIAQTGYKMTNIINELMLLSSVRKMEDVPTEPLDMRSIVAEVQDQLTPVIAESQAEVIAPAEWPTAVGYTPWVEHVWINYINNAAKYGGQPEAGVPPRIELGFDETPAADSHVRFWVRDNGPGLTPEEQAAVFAPFTRLHQARIEGHGLGLSIVNRIVEKLGGETGIKSELGQGSTFYFTLPKAAGP